tara:strand:+ start:999 stop:1415 length:417 start_codon:yes stop_codon:yes gene_type:complete
MHSLITEREYREMMIDIAERYCEFSDIPDSELQKLALANWRLDDVGERCNALTDDDLKVEWGDGRRRSKTRLRMLSLVDRLDDLFAIREIDNLTDAQAQADLTDILDHVLQNITEYRKWSIEDDFERAQSSLEFLRAS